MAADDVKGFTRFKFEIAQKLDAMGFRITVFSITFVLVMAAVFFVFGDRVKVNNAIVYNLAQAATALHKTDAAFKYTRPDGSLQVFKASEFRYQRPLLDGAHHLEIMLTYGGAGSALLALFLTYGVMRVFKKYRTGKKHKKLHIRGARLVEAEALADLVEEREEATPYLIGDVPIPASKVARHFYMSGDTGVGKTQLLMDLLAVVRARGEKAIVLDKNGELMSHFFNPDTDHILAPFDARSRYWTPYCEGSEEVDFERLAKSFIPTISEGKDDHWPQSSISVFTGLLYHLAQTPDFKGTIDEVLTALVESKKVVEKDLLGRSQIVVKRKIYELLKGTLASMSIDPDSPEHASSVIASVTPKIQTIRYLRGLENREKFSIREWAKNDAETGWLFLRVTEEQLDVVRPLVTAWVDTAIKAALSLNKSSTRVIWTVIDELQSLGKVNTLSKALFEGRKHGLRCLLGFTSVNELFQIYGRDSATAMLSQCNTKVVFQTDEPGAARWNAELLGAEEVIQESENMHYGDRDSKGINEHRDNQRLIVLPSEIQTLPNLTAYVKFAGDWPVARVKTRYTERPIIATATVERAMPPPLKIIREAGEVEEGEALLKESAAGATAKQSGYREGEPLI